MPYKICENSSKIERLNIKLTIKSEQILRLNEDKSFSHINAFNDFGFNPISFEEGIVEEIKLFEKNCLVKLFSNINFNISYLN